MAWLFALAAGLIALLGQRTARADGAFPASQSIMTPAELPHEILLATNFGLVSSVDDGQTWVWSCEQDTNSFGVLYQLGAPPLDRLYAVSQNRLVYSDDAACSWNVTAGVPAGVSITDAFPDAGNANHVLLVATGPAGDGGGALYSIFESTDGGATAGTVRYRAAAGDSINGVEIARSQPSTVYVTMLSGPTFIPKLGRSDDGGTTFQFFDVSALLGQKITSALIISVDPSDPQRVLLRVRGASAEHVGLTTNGGAGITLAADFPGGLINSFARMPSGTLVVGGIIGVDPAAFRSTDRGQTFSPLPAPPHLSALSARGSTLYGVADNLADNYAVGASDDEGMTWRPLVSYDQIQAIAACVKATCMNDCLMRAAMGQWPDTMCSATPMPQPIVTSPDGGPRDAAPDTAAPPADGSSDGTPATPKSTHQGCSCAAAPVEGPGGAWVVALALLFIALVRRPARW
jgi:MYXO-CTERM domain-containing protein